MVADVALTSNYFTVAVKDEEAAEWSGPAEVVPGATSSTDVAARNEDDKASGRQKRITAAVKKSRSEYKSEHAYTEREVSLSFD